MSLTNHPTEVKKSQELSQIHKTAIEALVKGEKEYVENLDRTIKVFIRPLSDVLDSKTRQILFCNFKDLYCIHVAVQADLECLSAHNIVCDLLCIFPRHKIALSAHGEYMLNIPKSIAKLGVLMNSDLKMKKKIEACESASSYKYRIKDLLLAANNRVQAYTDFLQEMQNWSHLSTADHQLLDKAEADMTDLIEHFNKMKTDTVSIDKVNEMENSMKNLKLSPGMHLIDYGHVIMEGMCKVRHSEANDDKSRLVILFQKILLFLRTLKDGSLEFDTAVDLHICKCVEDLRGNQFKILTVESPAQNWLISTPTKIMNRKWTEQCKNVLVDLVPQKAIDGSHHFILDTFSNITPCDNCNMLLRGLVCQGFYCSRSDTKAHKSCIPEIVRAAHLQTVTGTKSGSITVPWIPPKLQLPTIETVHITKRKYFGGYFGRIVLSKNLVGKSDLTNSQAREILLATVQKKIIMLKGGLITGGFTYTWLSLKAPSAAAPQTFIMWEDKTKGVRSQDFPKAGFLDSLSRRLGVIEQGLTLDDVEGVVTDYSGSVQSYVDDNAGETIVVGHYYEEPEYDSSGSEEDDLPGVMNSKFTMNLSPSTHSTISHSSEKHKDYGRGHSPEQLRTDSVTYSDRGKEKKASNPSQRLSNASITSQVSMGQRSSQRSPQSRSPSPSKPGRAKSAERSISPRK